MNKSREILSYLKRPDASRSLILAPNAPPIARSYASVDVALNMVMDAEDISDTLKHLHAESIPVGTAKMLRARARFPLDKRALDASA